MKRAGELLHKRIKEIAGIAGDLHGKTERGIAKTLADDLAQAYIRRYAVTDNEIIKLMPASKCSACNRAGILMHGTIYYFYCPPCMRRWQSDHQKAMARVADMPELISK